MPLGIFLDDASTGIPPGPRYHIGWESFLAFAEEPDFSFPLVSDICLSTPYYYLSSK